MPQGMTEREKKYTLSAPVCELGHLSQRERQGVWQYPLNYNFADIFILSEYENPWKKVTKYHCLLCRIVLSLTCMTLRKTQ